jgi:hypothetical protein
MLHQAIEREAQGIVTHTTSAGANVRADFRRIAGGR